MLSIESQRYFPGQTEMARRMREFDWTRTPLGPVETWPQSLRTSVSTCLDCAFPIVLWWGPDLVILYNDEYRPMLGPEKHPSALGQPGAKVWPEIWDVVGPMLQQVYERGEATRSRDLLLHIDRGYREEAYFSFSYSPILDEGGNVGGIFCPVIETTEKVIGERRLRTLRDLAAKCKSAVSEHHVYQSAAEVLDANRHDIPFALIYAIDDDQSVATLKATSGIQPGEDASPRILELSGNTEGIWSLSRVAHTGIPTLMTDLSAEFKQLPLGAWKTPAQSAMVLPVMRPGQERPHAILVAAVSPMRALDADYGTFFSLVATQIASALADARALEQERQRAEALAEIDRAKTVFFSNVSHEFRTPLTLMLGPIEDLMRNASGVLPQNAADTLQLAHRNGLRLLKLVNTLLDFARIEAGRVDASYECTDLPSFTAELASTFRSAIEKAGIHLMIDCPPLPETEKVFVDRDMWEKVVLNLLSNAFKFTFEGEIRVTLRALDGEVKLTVADTGTGIPESDLPKMFQRFHRIRNARARTHEGSGIGLALVQELAHLHGGEVTVQSEEGRGSAFSVSIKTGKDHLPEDRISAARSLSSTSTGANYFVEEALRWLPEDEDERKDSSDAHHATLQTIPEVAIGGLLPDRRTSVRVLVADDNADMRNYLARLLSRDYEVTAVADGAAALEAIQAQMPDLVLTDVMMPRLDGFGLLEAIRVDEKMRSLPVIMLSARAGEESRIEGLAAAADDYLTKPFSARELLARISSQLKLVHMRREIEESLKEAERKKDEFIAMLAHELRGPMAPLHNMLQVLNHVGAQTKPAQDARTVMERQLKHLARLVDDLLDVSRIARQSIELRRTRFDLGTIVRQAVETCGPLARSLQHQIHVSLPEAPINLDADAVRIGQVLGNLLNNACKYTNRQGNIWIHAEQQESEAIITVRDTGLGIPADSLDRIFEMFAQVERTLDHSQGGLGIGLTLVKRLVELHGGTISAKSEGIAGRGSEFVVRLPALAAEPEETPAPSGVVQPMQHHSSLRRILVVDDNVDSAQSLAMLLSLNGDQTRIAHDGMQAVLHAKEYDPHIVLLDIGLPRLNGYDTCREIRKLARGADIRIIAITGWGQEVDRAKSKDAGFDAHLVKPVEYDKLVEILEIQTEVIR